MRRLSPHFAELSTGDVIGLTAAARSIGGHVVPLAADGEAGLWQVVRPRESRIGPGSAPWRNLRVPIFNFQPIESLLESASESWPSRVPQRSGLLRFAHRLIAEREFRTYVATLTSAVACESSHCCCRSALSFPLATPVSLLSLSNVVTCISARSASTGASEAGRLEGKSFVFGQRKKKDLFCTTWTPALTVTFGADVLFSCWTACAHVIERDCRARHDAGDATVVSEQAVARVHADSAARLAWREMIFGSHSPSLACCFLQ